VIHVGSVLIWFRFIILRILEYLVLKEDVMFLIKILKSLTMICSFSELKLCSDCSRTSIKLCSIAGLFHVSLTMC
jgi:hypothetical protein